MADDANSLTSVDEQIESPGLAGARTRTDYLTLCPRCLARRRKTERLFLGMFVGLLAALFVTALVTTLLR